MARSSTGDKTSKQKKVQEIVRSYLLVHKDDPYRKLKTLQKYLKKKKKAKIKLKTLRDIVDAQLENEEKQKKLDEMEAELFTRDGDVKNYKYGSAFCRNCDMYKDYEKECPYCGSLEMTL